MSTASNGRARRSYIRDFISRIPIFRSTSTQGGTKEVDDGTHHHEPCYELAKKGEVLCRDCKFDDAIPILQEALTLGSEELSILSPIYSQLGHSYHAVGDLPNAYKYHCYEVVASRLRNDQAKECRAYGNVGAVLSEQNLFDEALIFTSGQVAIATAIQDTDCLADGFYSLAAIYVRRAKQMVKKRKTKKRCILEDENTLVEGRENFSSDPSCTRDLNEALSLYRKCASAYRSLNDESACGRVYGCLGNVLHLLGDYTRAVFYHERQLSIASEFDDVNAKYRAYINIGNAHHRRYKANSAIRYYQLALDLAVEESNRTRESKCCFCLANATYDIRDYHKAQEYSLRSMALAREQEDFTIMFHAYSMLARVCTKLDDYPKAAYFLACIRALAVQIHDEDMMTAAIESLIQLVEKHGQCLVSVDRNINFDGSNDSEPQSHVCRMKKVSGSISLTFTDQTSCEHVAFNETAQEERHALESVGAPPRKFEDDIIDLPLGVRSSRLDEQRCDIPVMLSRTITRRRQVDSGMVTLNDRRRVSRGEYFLLLLRRTFRTLLRPQRTSGDAGMVLDGEASRMMTQREVFLPGMKIKKATSALLHIPGYTLNEGVDPRIDEAIIDLLTNSREQGLNDQRSDVVITPKNSVGFGSIEEICVEEEASLVVIQLQAERLKASPLIEKL